MPTAEQVAFAAGYSPGTGTMNVYFGRLVRDGLISRDRGRVRLLPAGHAAAAGDGAACLDEYHARVMRVLDGPQQKIVREVIGHGADAEVPADNVARAAGYSPGTGTMNVYFGRLSRLGLIDRRQGLVRATENLFPRGLL